METCRIEDCGKPVRVKIHQLCSTHYARWNKYGDPLAHRRPQRQRCEVDGCDLWRVGGGLCDRHYRRVRRYGSTDAPTRPTVCGIDGCEAVPVSHALCDRHYRRKLRHGDPVSWAKCKHCGSDITEKWRRSFCGESCRQSDAYFQRRATHRSRWLRKYGLTPDGYDDLAAAQGDCCAICRTTSTGRSSEFWSVDHDHETGAVRGLLCTNCNSGLGQFKDNPALLEAAMTYLARPTIDYTP